MKVRPTQITKCEDGNQWIKKNWPKKKLQQNFLIDWHLPRNLSIIHERHRYKTGSKHHEQKHVRMKHQLQCHFQAGELRKKVKMEEIWVPRHFVFRKNGRHFVSSMHWPCYYAGPLNLPYTFTPFPAARLLDSNCRCIIIWLTAARLRDSDCHCISCSFLQSSFWSLFPITVQFDRSRTNNAWCTCVLVRVHCDCVVTERWEKDRTIPASWHIALWFFAHSGMELNKAPHFLTQTTASWWTYLALCSMMEEWLQFSTVGIMATTTSWARSRMRQKSKQYLCLQHKKIIM